MSVGFSVGVDAGATAHVNDLCSALVSVFRDNVFLLVSVLVFVCYIDSMLSPGIEREQAVASSDNNDSCIEYGRI